MKFLQFLFRWLPLFFRGAQSFIKDYVLPAIDIVETIKEALATNANFKELLVKLYGDENAAEAALDYVVKAIETLGVGKKCLVKETPIEIVECFIDSIKTLPKATRKGIYMQLAAQIAKATSNEDISDHEANTLVNMAYSVKSTQNAA